MNELRLILLAVVGAALVLGSLAWLRAEVRFGRSAARAAGEVVRLNAGGSHPEVRFETAAGQRVSYPQGGLVFGYAVGDRVAVLYDPARPRRAVVDTPGARFGFAGIGVAAGVVFLAAAAAGLRRALR